MNSTGIFKLSIQAGLALMYSYSVSILNNDNWDVKWFISVYYVMLIKTGSRFWSTGKTFNRAENTASHYSHFWVNCTFRLLICQSQLYSCIIRCWNFQWRKEKLRLIKGSADWKIFNLWDIVNNKIIMRENHSISSVKPQILIHVWIHFC